MVALRMLLLMLVAGALVAGFVLASQRDRAAEVGSYACPMHPEVSASAPGTCPICGMALTSIRGADSLSAAPDLMPVAGEISVARRRLLSEPIRAPSWVEADDEVAALLYETELAALAPDERGVFFSAAAPESGSSVVRRTDEAPSKWDASMSVTRFRLSAGARPLRRGDVGRLVIDPKPHEVLLVPLSAILPSAEGPYVLACEAAGSAYTKRLISVGKTISGFAVVQAGVVAEQRVIARGAFLLDAERRAHGL